MTPTVFYAPTDLRWVDPRPTITPNDDTAVVRELLAARLAGDELTRALRALGLEEYERAADSPTFIPLSRRESRTRLEERQRRQKECPQGHPRSTHGTRDVNGRFYCRTCKEAIGQRRREAAAERRKEQAA